MHVNINRSTNQSVNEIWSINQLITRSINQSVEKFRPPLLFFLSCVKVQWTRSQDGCYVCQQILVHSQANAGDIGLLMGFLPLRNRPICPKTYPSSQANGLRVLESWHHPKSKLYMAVHWLPVNNIPTP